MLPPTPSDGDAIRWIQAANVRRVQRSDQEVMCDGRELIGSMTIGVQDIWAMDVPFAQMDGIACLSILLACGSAILLAEGLATAHMQAACSSAFGVSLFVDASSIRRAR